MTPIHRPAIVLLDATLAATTLAAQDPLVVSPQAYRLRFENEWVKGEWQSELVYALLAREWRGGSAGTRADDRRY